MNSVHLDYSLVSMEHVHGNNSNSALARREKEAEEIWNSFIYK